MVYTVYKGVGLGIGVVAADLHDTTQAVTDNITFYRSFFFNRNHFDYSWKRVEPYLRVTSNLIYQIGKRIQRIKAQFSALMESPYTTLYQTVRTCNGLNWSEVA